MDETAGFEDVQLVIDDGGVFIRQYNEAAAEHDCVIMSHKMLNDLIMAMKTKEGVFMIEYRDKNATG